MRLSKIMLAIVFLGLVISIANGFSVYSEVPENAKYTGFNITLKINPEGENTFDIVEMVPIGWEIVNFNSDVQPVFSEHRLTQYMGENLSAYRWKFENVNKNITMTLEVKPGFSGNKIITVWTYPKGFDSSEVSINLGSTCGNGICEPGETPFNCSSDCKYLPQWSMVLVMLIATGIVILGLLYREYKKIKMRKIKKKKGKR